MPYRDFTERVENYDLAVNPEIVKMKFEARKAKMVQQMQKAHAQLTEMEKAVRSILDDEGILGVMRVPYLNFARALFRAKGHQGGLALRKTATAWKAKAVAEGLDPVILDKIIKAVIGEEAY
ncbi:MAG TPA: hypothetical protein EYH25_04425 [Thermotoga sp.]|nr:hypothetical protein [Thermotoga sp.]